MKMPMEYPTILLSSSLVIVFLTLLMVCQLFPNKEYTSVYVESADRSGLMAESSNLESQRLNLPGPGKKAAISPAEEGNPVFLKEDVADELTPKGAVQLTASEVDAEVSLVNQMTKEESSTMEFDVPDRFLILAGSYTDNMILLSKKAQYENKGLQPEIIRFNNKKARQICLGRFGDRATAKTFADELESDLGIRSYVLDRTQ